MSNKMFVHVAVLYKPACMHINSGFCVTIYFLSHLTVWERDKFLSFMTFQLNIPSSTLPVTQKNCSGGLHISACRLSSASRLICWASNIITAWLLSPVFLLICWRFQRVNKREAMAIQLHVVNTTVILKWKLRLIYITSKSIIQMICSNKIILLSSSVLYTVDVMYRHKNLWKAIITLNYDSKLFVLHVAW